MDIEGGSFTLWEEFYNASIRLLKLEKYTEAKRLAKKSLNEAIDVYGPSHSTSGMSLFLIGLISQYQAEFAEAEVSYEKALSIFERIFLCKGYSCSECFTESCICLSISREISRSRTTVQKSIEAERRGLWKRKFSAYSYTLFTC